MKDCYNFNTATYKMEYIDKRVSNRLIKNKILSKQIIKHYFMNLPNLRNEYKDISHLIFSTTKNTK